VAQSTGTAPGVRWRWPYALRGFLTVLPAGLAAFHDVQLAAALAVGLLPVCPLPLPPSRLGRVRLGMYGVMAAASICLGGFLAQWPPVAVIALILAGGGLGHLVVRLHRPVAMLGLLLCLPLFAVGLSYPGVDKVSGLAVDLLLGTAWSVLVAVAWPRPAPLAHPVGAAAPDGPPDPAIVGYGWAAGVTGAVCATIGFAAGLEHVGWAPAAALLVMRPNPPMQRLRSMDRVGDVALGAVAASLLVVWDPPAAVYALAIAAVVVTATATAGSRWYVLPTFTTFLVFILLLARDPSDAQHRFWERLLETLLGVAVAAVTTIALGAIARRAGHQPHPAHRAGGAAR